MVYLSVKIEFDPSKFFLATFVALSSFCMTSPKNLSKLATSKPSVAGTADAGTFDAGDSTVVIFATGTSFLGHLLSLQPVIFQLQMFPFHLLHFTTK